MPFEADEDIALLDAAYYGPEPPPPTHHLIVWRRCKRSDGVAPVPPRWAWCRMGTRTPVDLP
jgi:hypothetical protein